MKSHIRILELIFDFQVGGKGGGIGRFAIELSKTLNYQQFDRFLGGIFDRGTTLENDWMRQLNAENISAFCASKWDKRHPYLSFWNSAWFLWKWQSENKVSIIHSHSEFSDIAALILKFHPTHPIIIRSVHYGFQYEWRKRPMRRMLLTNFLFPLLYEKEIGVSQAITDNLDQRILAKLLKRRAKCVYNAIDIHRFQLDHLDRESKRNSLNIPAEALLVGTVGRLTEQKGFCYLIDAAAIVVKQIPQVYFIIVGDGELAEKLKKQTRDLGINQRLLFTGARTDIEEIFGCLDLFVSSSLWEGLPTVIMESMAAGIPVVANDIPGNRELILDQHTGWLAQPANSSDLADKIITALENPQTCREFSNRGLETVKRFSIKSISSEHERMYFSLKTSGQKD